MFLRAVLISLGFLLIPLLAMFISDEMNWGPEDFVAAGLLFFGATYGFLYLAKRSEKALYRVGVGIMVGTALLLVWVNMAVGVIGSEDNPANLVYLLVLAIAMGGAFWTRSRTQAMVRVLSATAIIQLLIGFTAFFWIGHNWMVDGFFATLWLSSAFFLRKSSVE